MHPFWHSVGVDYYALRDPAGDGLLVEKFIHAPDHTTVGLTGLLWTGADPRWLGASSFSRALRSDPLLLARVTPTTRAGAADAYARLGGGHLPTEWRFPDPEPFAVAPPLRLGPPHPPDGFHERRLYRVLFAKDPVSAVRWPEPRPGFTWELRRVGGVAWALDVTVLLATPADDAVGPVLHDLTDAARCHGLIPVTTERFA